MKKKSIFLLCLILFSFCVSASAQETESFPSFESIEINGEPLSADVFSQADFTLVKFWATWCGACRMEMPEYPVYLEDENYKVQILGILMDDLDVPQSVYEAILKTAQKITSAASLDSYDNYFCILPDETLLNFAMENVQYLPSTFLVDSQGNILDMQIGVLSYEQWQQILSEQAEILKISPTEKAD